MTTPGNEGGRRDSCERICADAGARCVPQPMGLDVCPDEDRWAEDLDENGLGCVIYWPDQSVDTEAITSCQQEIGPRSGYNDPRRRIHCICEGTDNPPEPEPLGILLPEPGEYEVRTLDTEIVVLRIISPIHPSRISLEVDQPGLLRVHDHWGDIIDEHSDPNVGPMLLVPTDDGLLYYATFQTWPRFAQTVHFTVDF